MRLDLCLTLYKDIHRTQILDLSVRPETYKHHRNHLRGAGGEQFKMDAGTGHALLSRIQLFRK